MGKLMDSIFLKEIIKDCRLVKYDMNRNTKMKENKLFVCIELLIWSDDPETNGRQKIMVDWSRRIK